MSRRIEMREKLLGSVEDFREDGPRSYRIESEGAADFKLTMKTWPVRDSDPLMRVSVTVFSDGFCGKGDMEVPVKKLANFAVNLKNLYETLKGSARLEEPYFPNNFIEFVVKKTGRVVVSGRIHDCYPRPRTLTFEDEIDQTYLRGFATALFADFGK